MNGSRYLLDTNAIIQLLKGNDELIAMVSHAEFLAVSIIAELEYYSLSGFVGTRCIALSGFQVPSHRLRRSIQRPIFYSHGD